MGKKKTKKEKVSKATVKARIVQDVSVEKIEIPTKGMSFVIGFNVLIPQGTNNFYEMVKIVDKTIRSSRDEVIEKIANHIGAQVKYQD